MKNLKKIIFTKFDEKFIKKNKDDIFYAGYWASNSVDLKKNQEYLKCVWSTQREKDHSYVELKKQYVKYLDNLTHYFNKYHNLNHSKKYWEIICGIWLSTYLSTIYYRWNVVKKISSNKKIIINNYNFKNFFLTTNNSIEYYSKITRSDTFNNLVFYKIINYFITNKNFKPFLEKKKINFQIKNKKIHLKRNFSFKTKIFNKLAALTDLFLKRKKKFIIIDGFRNIINIKLNLSANQFPFPTDKYFKNELSINKNLFNYEKRKKNIIPLKTNNSFEKFLEKNIYYDIPKIFLENFIPNLNLVKSYKIKCNKIVSSFSHHYNELFKIWLANNIQKKDKYFIITCHGGNHSKYSGLFNYENNISDKNISWVKNAKYNLPASKYINLKKNRNKSDNLVLVINETNPYPAKWEDFPVCLDNLKLDFFLKKFQLLLNKKIKKNFFVCPKYFHCPKFKKILRRNLEINQIKKNFSFSKELDNAKLVICDNPQTAFLDALRTGPTILIIKKNEWRPQDILKKNYKELEKNKIIFYSLDKAIKHINENWDDINKWWLSNKTKKAVNRFLNDMNCFDNSVDKWATYLNKN